jgi:hypothetical protein
MRVSEFPDPGGPSDTAKCKECGMDVWVGKSSPPADQYICVHCWADLAGPDDELLPPTPEQLEMLKRLLRK